MKGKPIETEIGRIEPSLGAGKREIDVYRNGLMFERDHVVGVRGTR
jgi:hypothetical protein